MSYTPGPWEFNKYGAVKGGPVVEFSRGFGREQIAMVCARQFAHVDIDMIAEREDNARLMAAAPDLIEALKALLFYPDRWCCCTAEQEAAGHTGECLQAQAAIAKADGK